MSSNKELSVTVAPTTGECGTKAKDATTTAAPEAKDPNAHRKRRPSPERQ